MIDVPRREQTATTTEATVTDLFSLMELLREPRLAQLYPYFLHHGSITVEPIEVSVEPVHLQVQTEHGAYEVSPVLIDAVGRTHRRENEDIATFVERNGLATLAAAIDYAVANYSGEITQRMARRANSRDDIVEKTDTALAGLAVHLFTTDQEVSMVTILMADTGAAAAMRDVFAARSYDDSISIVDGRQLAIELVGDDDVRLL